MRRDARAALGGVAIGGINEETIELAISTIGDYEHGTAEGL